MYRYIEAIFSHKLLIALPLLIIVPLSAIGGLLLGRSYEVGATIWIDSSPLLGLSDAVRGYRQPNAVEADAFNEWLGTKLFVRELIQRAGLQDEIDQGRWPKSSVVEDQVASLPLVGSLLGKVAFAHSTNRDTLLDRAIDRLRKSLSAEPRGDHLVRIGYKGDDPDLGVSLVGTSIELFNERRTGRKSEQNRSAIDFFETQLKERSTRLEAATQAVRRYKAENPVPREGDRPAQQLQELANLERQESLERQIHEDMSNRLEQAKLAGAADLQKAQASFRIADPPEAPPAGGLDKKKIIMFVVVGLMAALSLGLGTVIVLEWAGGTMRCSDDCLAVAEVPVLGTIPHLVVPKQLAGETRGAHRVRHFLSGLVAGEPINVKT